MSEPVPGPPTPPEPVFKPTEPVWVQNVLTRILHYCEVINSNQVEIEHRLHLLETSVDAGNVELTALANADAGMASALSTLVQTDTAVAANLQSVLTQENADSSNIAEILAILKTPPPSAPAVAFQVEVVDANSLNRKGDSDMAKSKTFKLKFKVSIPDNGTATGTITGIVDAAGLPTSFDAGTVPTWICETTPGAGADPNIVLTVAADGMSCVVAPATPPALVSGDTITVTATGPVMGTLTGTYSPVNVVAGPASTFVVSVQ